MRIRVELYQTSRTIEDNMREEAIDGSTGEMIGVDENIARNIETIQTDSRREEKSEEKTKEPM